MQLTRDLTDTASELPDLFSRLGSALQLQEEDREASRGRVRSWLAPRWGKLESSLTAAGRRAGQHASGHAGPGEPAWALIAMLLAT